MGQSRAATSIVALCTCIFATACGSPSNPSTAIQTNSKNTNITNQLAAIHLTSFRGLGQMGIQVKVPQGWTKTYVHGGDYSGWKFTNPAQTTETELVIESACVGCYLDSNGQPNPVQVIPQGDNHIQTTRQTRDSIQYRFTQTKNPNSGRGMLVTSRDQAGYAYVETLLPSQQQTVSTDILASFSYSL